MQKTLLLLEAGLALTFLRPPQSILDIPFEVAKEWRKINRRTLYEAIRKLYQSKLVDYKENKDRTITLVLSDAGKKKALTYNPYVIKLVPRKKWDGLWRMVIFDIPEYKKKERDALSARLKHLGFIPVQKSVFVWPYECRDEVDFLIELFDLRSFVRYLVVKEIDNDLHLRAKFNLV